MKWRKTTIAVFCSAAAALNTGAIGFALASGNREDLLVGILQLLFALYLLAISASLLVQDDAERHSQSIVHITFLSFPAALLLVSAAILPKAAAPGVISDEQRALHGLWYALALMYATTCVVGITTRRGPPLHFPLDQIYSEKTAASITNPDLVNVSGAVGMLFNRRSSSVSFLTVSSTGDSIWGMLMFSYATKVVWLSNVAESLDIGDLPIVPRNMRAAYNYARTRRALRESQFRVFRWKPQPGSGWNLVYTLFRLNLHAFIAEVLLAISSAFLFYSPAFFIRLLIRYLESDPKREKPGWGWVYIFGLLMAYCILYLGKSFVKGLPVRVTPIDYLMSSHRSTVGLGNSYNSGSSTRPAQHRSVRQNSR
jgi:hypothetical protein